MYQEQMPSGGRKTYVSAQQIRNLKKGGEKARHLHQEREEHHASVELPEAEAKIDAELGSLPSTAPKDPLPSELSVPPKPKTFWQKLFSLFSPR